MSLPLECSGSQQPLRRSHKRSLDNGGSVSLHPNKRQQLPSSLTAPGHSLDKATQPNSLQIISSMPTEPSSLLKKAVPKDVNPVSDPQAKKRYIENWLAKHPAIRASSCPPRLPPSEPLALGPGEEQWPQLEVLQEMAPSQMQSVRRTSAEYTQTSRLPTSHPDYRWVLHTNAVYIDHTGANIPHNLQRFLNSEILKERSLSLSPESVAEAVNTAVAIADKPEGRIYDLVGTAMLPIKRSDIERGGNTPWYTNCLPKKDIVTPPLAQPKPDVHCGYLMGQGSSWTFEEDMVIGHQQARQVTQPAKGNCFPFFVIEMKSEAMGGNIWQAENQAAGSGACCVNALRWLFSEAYGSKTQSVIDSIAFSACVTHREVVFHVHHYSAAENRHYMSSIGTFQTMCQVQECNNVVRNIFKHALGPRQKKIRDALKQLYPFPEHWKNARSSSVMESQGLGADNE